MVIAAVLAAATVYVGTLDDPSPVFAGVLQAITMALGLWGSFLFGKDSSRRAAEEIVRPHARSAFRRVRNLYLALGRQRQAIAAEQSRLDELSVDGDGSAFVALEHVRMSLQALDYIVTEQISTADDALEDWRDLVPDEVKAIEDEAKRREADE